MPTHPVNEKTRSRQSQQLGDQPIAIIGISALFPEALDLNRYWSNILDKIDSIIDVPESRWKIDDYYDSNPETPDKTYCKRGGFIQDIDFNPMDFGIPPNILEVTDSAQLLGLMVAKSALEDSGYGEANEELLNNTGVILGVTSGMKLLGSLTSRLQYPIWERVLKRSGLADDETRQIIERIKKAYVRWEENSFPGLLGNVIAGRIANRLNLGGTNCTVDAACASSLSAMKMAISDLTEHRADLMITGGVDADNSPFMFMCFSKTPAFTQDEQSKPFAADSEGIMIGEGLGMLVLKRLEDAQSDGDRVYAVIKGIGTSSDGRFKSIYAPRSGGQAKALRRAHEDAGISPDAVSLIEAHGTGTTAGDLAEFEGLQEVFSENNPRKQHIALGSVKSQIGHTKAAAGVAGMIKAALALHHKILPPTINVEKPNPKLDIEKSPFYLNTEPRPWFSKGNPRRAGISSFGFGGTNYHLVLEEHTSTLADGNRVQETPRMILISSLNPEELISQCGNTLEKLSSENGDAHHLKLLKETNEHPIPKDHARLGFVTSSKGETRELLELALKQLETKKGSPYWNHKGIAYAEKARETKGTLVALFSGQGSQSLEMGRELFFNFPPMLETFYALDQQFLASGSYSLSDVVFPIPVFDSSERKNQEAKLQLTENAQPAIGGISAGLYRILQQAGFQPDFVAGHSFGELTALWAAEVISTEDYYKLAHARGKAMAAPDDPDFDAGSMLAVMGKVDQLEKDIEDLLDVKLANLNSNKQVVLAGPKEDVEEARQKLKAKKYTVVPLPVSAAFHTPLVGHAQIPFAEAIRSVKFNKPKIPVYSNATGKPYPKAPEKIQKQLEEHILQSVRFRDEIEQIHCDGGRIFIEFGPKNVLTKLVENILSGEDCLAVALNENPKKNSDRLFREAMVKLCVAGLPMQKFDPYAPALPIEAKKSSPLAIKLNGANYVSDNTRKAFEDALENWGRKKQDPPGGPSGGGNTVTSRSPVIPIAAAPSPVMQADTIQGSRENRTADQSKPNTNITMTANNNKSAAQGSGEESYQASHRSAPSLDQSLAGYYQHQNETLQVHRQYLDQQSEYSRTVLQLMQQQLSLTSQGGQIPASVDRHLGMFHEHQSQTLRIHEQYLLQQAEQSQAALQITRQQLGLPQTPVSQTPEPLQNRESAFRDSNFTTSLQGPPSVGPSSTLPAVVVQTAPAAEPPAPASTPAPAVIPTADETVPAQTPEQAVLSIVSEKTGYPPEMLELSMDLEADLGIDSIKRVEILGSLQDQLPGLPEIRGEELGELRTLGQILDYLQSLTSSGSSSGAPAGTFEPSVSSAGLNLSVEVEKTIYAIVSEKTGYPPEMLDLSMDMEADLGIDSIKRVEILGSLQDQLPGLPEIRGEELAELRNLGQIVDYLKGLLPDHGDEFDSTLVGESGTESLSTQMMEPDQDTLQDPSRALLAVVAEKTGYPAEMLELSMDMEADLGIDSIKRVEIMWAVQEKFPELPQLGISELGELRTLEQIVEFMKDLLPAIADPSIRPTAEIEPETAPLPRTSEGNGNGDSRSASGLEDSLLKIIGEKTGYPPEMLEMSMDLEADLGIDSIKRVEIMWAVQEKYPDLPQVGSAEMSELRTLRQIADHLGKLLSAGEFQTLPNASMRDPGETSDSEKKNL